MFGPIPKLLNSLPVTLPAATTSEPAFNDVPALILPLAWIADLEIIFPLTSNVLDPFIGPLTSNPAIVGKQFTPTPNCSVSTNRTGVPNAIDELADWVDCPNPSVTTTYTI